MNKVIDCKLIRDIEKERLRKELSNLDKKLKLVVIQVGNDPASSVYVKNKELLCNSLDINFEHLKYDDIDEENLIKKIKELNTNDEVTGILVQLPLPKHLNEEKIINTIDYRKDVDGLTSINLGNLFSDKEAIIPCTALGVMKILDSLLPDMRGMNAVIIGRTKLVGIPLIKLLLNKNTTVTICHSKTKNLKEITNKADILITAVGKKDFITEEMIKPEAIIIDVGINRVDDKIYGDVNLSSVIDKCSFITPVPKGVGLMTVAMLVNNLLKCYQMQEIKNNNKG